MNPTNPAIPARVRTVAYFIGLAIGALTILATGVTAAVAPSHIGTVVSVSGAVTGAATFVLGALGVAFRPTAGGPSAADLWGDGTPVAVAPSPVSAPTVEPAPYTPTFVRYPDTPAPGPAATIAASYPGAVTAVIPAVTDGPPPGWLADTPVSDGTG